LPIHALGKLARGNAYRSRIWRRRPAGIRSWLAFLPVLQALSRTTEVFAGRGPRAPGVRRAVL